MPGFFGLFGAGMNDWTGLTVDELSIWAERVEHLNDLWLWYDGTRLREEDEALPMDRRTGKRPLRYPLQINLVKPAVRSHSFALWGETEDTSEPLVRTIVEPPFDETIKPAPAADGTDPGFPGLPRAPSNDSIISNNADRPNPSEVTEDTVDSPVVPAPKVHKPAKSEAAKDARRAMAKHAQRVLSDVFYENNMRSMLVDTGQITQVLGGVVFKVGWDPENIMLPTGIRIEYVDPRNFHARWQGTDYWNLTEGWIKLTIAGDNAKEAFGVTAAGKTALYVEYWSRNRMWIKIDGQIATIRGQKMDVQHNWGFVPMAYIPHERVNGYWGLTMVQDMIGLTREVNARMADMGDAIRLAIKRILKAKNLKGGHPTMKQLPSGATYYDLGRAISQGDPQPDLDAVPSPSLPVGAEAFQELLLETARTQLLTPSIVYGEEEGSQRSGQTLYQRMWPLLAHTRQERDHWTVGLNLMAEMILKILAAKNRAGIGPQHLGLRKRQLFAPPVPVDREKLVDELIRRSQENAIAPAHMLQAFGDVSDVEEELAEIDAKMQREAELELLGNPKPPLDHKPINNAESKE